MARTANKARWANIDKIKNGQLKILIEKKIDNLRTPTVT